MKYKIVLFDTLFYGSRFCGEHRSALLIRAKGAPEYLVTQQSPPLFRIAVSSVEFNFFITKDCLRIRRLQVQIKLSVIWIPPWFGYTELSGFHCKIGFQRPNLIKQDGTLAIQRKLDLFLMIDLELQDLNMIVKSGKTLDTSFVKLYHFKEISKKNMMYQK